MKVNNKKYIFYFLQKVVQPVAREGSLAVRAISVPALLSVLFFLSCTGGRTSTADEKGDTIAFRRTSSTPGTKGRVCSTMRYVSRSARRRYSHRCTVPCWANWE